jgi:peptidoglycan hydrolase-like protein with peptidoglycan-binding domain
VIGGAVVVWLLAAGVPAGAHSITGFNWTSVDQLCISGPCVSQGNLVGAWQSILWADGYLNKCGSSGIDGYFGSITQGATKTWQGAHGLTKDGVVGPLTWGKARAALVFVSSRPIYGLHGRLPSTVQNWDYVGKKHTVHFQYASSIWAFRAPANPNPLPYYATSHPSIFFTRC